VNSVTKSDRPTLVFLYGPPAVGKLTVAKELAKRLPLRILHNHLTIDPVAEILEFGTTGFWDVVERFREDLVESAAREGVDVVYTYVFALGDEPHVARVVDASERHGGQVTFVQLLAPREELVRRVAEADRKEHRKLSDASDLQRVLEEYDVYTPIPGRSSLSIDVAVLPPAEAADLILKHLELGKVNE
jgi:shikimate kinase